MSGCQSITAPFKQVLCKRESGPSVLRRPAHGLFAATSSARALAGPRPPAWIRSGDTAQSLPALQSGRAARPSAVRALQVRRQQALAGAAPFGQRRHMLSPSRRPLLDGRPVCSPSAVRQQSCLPNPHINRTCYGRLRRPAQAGYEPRWANTAYRSAMSGRQSNSALFERVLCKRMAGPSVRWRPAHGVLAVTSSARASVGPRPPAWTRSGGTAQSQPTLQ